MFREEIAEPLGADFHIGLAAEHDPRVADLIPPPPGTRIADGEQGELNRNMSTNPPINPLDTRTRAWRAAEIPAAGGHGNARSIAQIHALLANGGTAKGKRIISEAGCRKALEPQIEGVDLIFNAPAKYGMGFGLPGPMVPLPNPNSHLLGRLRRLAGDHRHGCAHHHRLRDEQDGRHHHRRHPRPGPGHGHLERSVRLRRAGAPDFERWTRRRACAS